MEWLNYHHLFYFHAVVREGGVAAAARKLRVSHPTVSAQLRLLEEALGEDLFDRRGRTLTLTEGGRYVAQYAEEIFSLGRELVGSMRRRPTAKSRRLVVGIAAPVPRLIARRLLAVYDTQAPPVRLTLRQGTTPSLLEDLVAHRVDVVLADAPGPVRTDVFDHPLGECGTTFFAAPALAAKLVGPFPDRLDGAPFLMPGPEGALRRDLEEFFAQRDLHPRVVAEIDDSALLKVYAQDGAGIFAGATALADEISRQFHVVAVGETDSIRERYHLLTTERRIAEPLLQLLQNRGHALFATPRGRRSKGTPKARRRS